MIEFIRNLSAFIVALGILITIHEYGHYWVARRCGVKVLRFSIGFGKPLWKKIDKHGTEFVLAAIPLGGYVKMLDERVDTIAEQDKHNTFNVKSVYQRIAIIAAGPMANFIFAIFAFMLMYLIGVPSIKPIVGSVEQQSIAEQANIQPNTQIVAVAGHKTHDWQDVNMYLTSQMGESSIEIKTRQLDTQYVKTYQLNIADWHFSPEKSTAMASLGLLPFRPQIFTEIAKVQPNSPASKAGLKVGDKLVEINQQNIVNNWDKFTHIISQHPEQELTLQVDRNGDLVSLVVKPKTIENNGKMIGFLGVVPKQAKYPDEFRFNLQYGPIDAINEGMKRTWRLVTLSFDMIGKLLTGQVSVNNLSGPIAIAQGAGASADYGLVYFLGFLALISVNLGIINLLPLPVLDGGHLLYYLIELLSGKPVPEKVQEVGFRFGALALLGLMSIAIFNDLSRL